MFIVDDILLAPIKGLMFIAGHIHKEMERELNDESNVKRELMRLQIAFEEGGISQDEFEAARAEQFAILRDIKARQMDRLSTIHDSENSDFIVEEHARE